jgi:hypothetical protein
LEVGIGFSKVLPSLGVYVIAFSFSMGFGPMAILSFTYPPLAYIYGSLYIILQYVNTTGTCGYLFVVSKGQLGDIAIQVEELFAMGQCLQYGYHMEYLLWI